MARSNPVLIEPQTARSSLLECPATLQHGDTQ